MKTFSWFGAALVFVASCTCTQAADTARDYPAKPIRLIVPYPAGGATDIVGREIGQRLSDAWGQPVVIDNRGGAGSVIGHNVAAKSIPDGYTLLLGTSAGLVLNPLISKSMPYDAFKDFAPVSLAVISPQLLVVNAQLPASTVKELIALAKAKPGQLNFASPGPGSPNHLGGELFKSMAGINIVHVPYKGGAPAITDLIAGQVHLLFNSIPPVLPHVKSGRLKAIGVGGVKRSLTLPEIPTVAETLPGFQCVTWYGIFAPAGTPAPIIAKINAEVVKTLAAPDVAKHLIAQGVEPGGSTPEQLTQFMREEHARWKRVIAAAGLN